MTLNDRHGRHILQTALTALLAALLLLTSGTSYAASTLATFAFGSGWATFGIALPQGAAQSGLLVGSLPTQTDIKTTWPDGSIRFAIVTAQITSAASYPITSGPSTAGSFTPTWPAVAVEFTTGGTTYTANLPAFVATDLWLSSGSLVREARVLVAPTSGGNSHALLQVVFDIRSYSAGGHRVDITVQNVKDCPGTNSVIYNVTVRVGGAAVFSKSNVNHSYQTRWRKVFLTGGLSEASVTPDFEPFYRAKAIPRYEPQVVDPVPSTSGSNFDILGFGDMTPYMGAPGGRAEIAPYPNWTAQYLIHKRPQQRAYMLKHADLSGSWSGHITEPDGRTLISLDTYPSYWLDGRAGKRPYGPDSERTPGYSPGSNGYFLGSTEGLESAHIPSLTFVPYLVTGDRYYLDQAKLWANFSLLATWPGDGSRENGKGILYQNQPRGFGWALRNLADCTAYLPDNDPTRQYFRTRVQYNVDFLERYANTVDGGPLGVTFHEKFDDGSVARTCVWQLSFLAFAADRCVQHGFASSSAFRDRVVRFQIRLFNSEPEYPRAYGAPYYPAIGTIANGRYVFYQTMGEVWRANYAPAEPPQPFVGYYGPDARMLLLMGVEKALPGATSALSYLTGQPGVLNDVYDRSGWALTGSAPSGRAPAAPGNLRIR